MATALIDAPDWLMALYSSGRCRGLTELYELRRLHAEQPQRTEALVAEAGEASLGRGQLATWRQPATPVESPSPAKRQPKVALALPVLLVQHEGQAAALVTNAFPENLELVYIQPTHGPRLAVPAAAVRRVGHGPRSGLFSC